MRSGGLRTRIEIQARSITLDAHGGESLSWTAAADRYAKVTPLSGREYMDAQRVDSDVSHEVTMRYYSSLSPSHRIILTHQPTRILNIKSVIHEERKRQTVAMCSEDV